MNLKEMLNSVLEQSGFISKDSFTDANDIDNKQMIAIANRVAYEIANFYDWNELRVQHELIMTTGKYRYLLPDGYQSYIPDSAWETDGSRKVDIPVDDQTWYQFKFSSLSTAGVIRARFMGDYIEIIDPFEGGSFLYEYITKWVVLDDLHQPKQFFTADTDTWLLDDQLLILGVQAHWQQTKMMPTYMEHMANYMVKMNEAISRSNQGSTIGGKTSVTYGSPYTKTWVN